MENEQKKARSHRDAEVQQRSEGEHGTGLKDKTCSPKGPVERCIFITCLLSQFAMPRVRSDIVRHKLVLPDVSLEELDALCLILLPGWCNNESLNSQLFRAQGGMIAFVLKKDSSFSVGSEYRIRTCGEWMKLLYSIASDTYWTENKTGNAFPWLNDTAAPNQLKECGTNTDLKLFIERTTNTPALFSPTIKTVSESRCTSAELVIKPESSTNADDLSDYVEKVPTLAVNLLRVVPKENVCCNRDDESKKEYVCSESIPALVVTSHHCSHCGIRGHKVATCWRRLKSCLICGGDHHMEECIKFVRKPLETSNVVCPQCQGNHVGRFCPQTKTRMPPCNWCGKRGHRYDNCYWRLGSCLVCGSHEHKVEDCPKVNKVDDSDKPLVFPPWCVSCAGHHLGSDCDSPYME